MYLRPLRLLRILLLLLCVCCIVPWAFSATAHATSDPMQVTAQTDSISFPKSIDFRMSAMDSSSNITQATLNVAGDNPASSVPSTSSPMNFKAARTISVDYRDDISGTNFITPGTPMQYYWVLKDSAGNTHTEAIQHFLLIDSRFSWQHLTQGMVTIDWYNRPPEFGQTLLADATNSISHISKVLGGGLLHPINLWVYETPDDFHGSLAPNSYEWVGGIAFPQLSQAFISVTDLSDTTLIRDMPHELTHLVFHQLIAQGIQAPIWFDEGLAVYNQQYHEQDMSARFNEAVASHSLLRLSEISFSFPADADMAYLAYAQSWNLISYMYNTFGQPRMARFIRLMNNPNGDFSGDLTQAIGEDTLHLENQWRLSLHQPPVLVGLSKQPTATTQTVTIPSNQLPSTTDRMEPLFVSLGILLIVIPLFSIVFIIINERRKLQRDLVAQDAQRIMSMALGQNNPTATRNQYGVSRSPGSGGTGSSYFSPFPSSLPKAPPGENTSQYPGLLLYKEYPQQGEQKQAPQE